MRLTGLGAAATLGNPGGCPLHYDWDAALGLCRSGATILAPPSAGVSIDVAKNACAVAKGVWVDDPPSCAVADNSLPASCSGFSGWISSLFGNSCQLPATAGDLQALDSGQYTNFKIAQTNPDVAAVNVAANEASAQSDINKLMSDCSYAAAVNYPGLTAVVGPDVTCALTDPFNSYGWLIYAAIGIGAYMLLKGK